MKEKFSICITYEISESVRREGSALSDDYSKLCKRMDFHNTNRGRILRRGFVVRHVGSVDTMNEEPSQPSVTKLLSKIHHFRE